MKGYPGWFPKLLFAVLAGAFVTGCLLAPSAIFYRLERQVPWRLGGGARNLVGAIHVVAGFGLAALLGAVWGIHIRHNWRLGLNWRSGLCTVLALVALGFTGIGCMYLGGEWSAPLNSIGHILLGLAAPAALLVHAIRGRRLVRYNRVAPLPEAMRKPLDGQHPGAM